MYVRVVVDTEAASYLDSFTYEVPEDLRDRARVGACVLVPFGKAQVVGYVVGIEEIPSVEKTRAILGVIDSPITLSPELVDLARWISDRYICGLSRCAHSILPGVVQCRVRTMVDAVDCSAYSNSPLTAALSDAGGSITIETVKSLDLINELRKLDRNGAVKRRYELVLPEGKARMASAVTLAVPDYEAAAEAEKIRTKAPRQAEVLDYLAEHGTASCSIISSSLGASDSVISALATKGLVRKMQLQVRREVAHSKVASTTHHTLTPGQQGALDVIGGGISLGKHETTLIHGVTASGKTEVYLRAIEQAREAGRRSLVLLPEISLTTQVLNIFRTRFGDRVAVLHSMLSPGERFDEWSRTESGDVDVVLGARSAIYAPVNDLGLIIVDEEHEPSYKQDVDPRYHGRDVALRRAEENSAIAVLGSATPSIESYYKAKKGNYRLVVMGERIEQRPMPTVTVADLRDEYKKGHATIFSESLSEGIASRLSKGQQIILFQNRRAYATFLLCRECGHSVECPHCAVSLKLHASERMMRCHHCDYEQAAPDACPKCGGLKIGKFGIGTERIEEETKIAFPGARVIRMDRDTTTRKGSHAQILDAFRKREADILVGTQMIAKGLDFPGVTLVGVISADTSLNLPDYRAGERTFQLLSQVSGRAGRGEDLGEVVIQTFNPEHYAVVAAAAHDYESFYDQEITLREEHGFPPFAAMVNIVASDVDEPEARRRLYEVITALQEKTSMRGANIDVLGPVPSPVSRLRGRYRWHVVLKSPDRDYLLSAVREALDAAPTARRGVVVDVDPASML